MIRYNRSSQVFAICLAALAGYVDAVGFIALGGFFVSFMSGNSTRLSVGLAGHSQDALVAARLIGAFVLGVVAGSLAGRPIRRFRASAVLVLVALLLAAAAFIAGAGHSQAAMPLVAMAMGVENTVFERDGEVSIGLTYMTGTLVKFGQRVAMALTGEDRFGWAPYLLLWVGLILGAAVGALSYPRLGVQELWIAAATALVLALAAGHPALRDREAA